MKLGFSFFQEGRDRLTRFRGTGTVNQVLCLKRKTFSQTLVNAAVQILFHPAQCAGRLVRKFTGIGKRLFTKRFLREDPIKQPQAQPLLSTDAVSGIEQFFRFRQADLAWVETSWHHSLRTNQCS